ncbi:hypothetical protein HZS61_006799 [Fusarium oxysporum f. sp. conglutinans]|uniref:Uncharacterized protein n=1 Tax=Fusarium oxysporum f. sp. conglutinans TaxID=100902 RepID=A0A8H6G862_FUSOX|nr:hypothetical protein HZS61_006799 [Fusarium oxysporum f. sp. conglutinans]
MDPVSAIGLASGILTFVEAGLKLVKIAYNIHNSLDGVLDDNRHRESVTSEVSKAALRLEVAGNARLTPEQESLSDLAKKCKATSTELVKAFNEVKPKRSSSNPFKSLRYAVKTNVKAKDINGLENQLKDYRDQLILALVEFSRVEAADGFSELISLAKENEATLKSLTQAIEHLRQSQISVPDSIFNTHACSQFQRLLMVDDETRRAMYQDQVLESLKFDEMHQRFDAVHSAHEDTFKWIYEPIETIEEDDDLSLEDDNWSNVEEHGLTYEERIRREALKVLAETLHQRAELTVVDNRQEIPSSAIKDALERLLQNDKLYRQHKFCIFIDGLDEFEPGVQDGLDYIDLVNVLRQWTIHADGNLKLCLSSREEGVFMDEYASDPSFRLQDLTRFDMQNYVRSRLSNLKDENLKSDLATEIPEKSSGIFLWTYLVVKTIRNKMTHRATSETLRKHLNTLPRGLEALFHHILQQLEPDDARKTLRIIDSLQTAKSNYIELPLLAFPLLDRYDQDLEFSLRDGLEDEPIPDEELLQAQLRGACGGLIECHEGRQYERLQVLEFVHRSVPDMFYKDTKGSELSVQMEAALDGTDTIDVVSHVCFATLRLSGQKGTESLGKPLVDWDKNFTEEFLFREWVAFTDWPNRDTLLELLDCNSTMRYNNVIKPRPQSNNRCLYNDSPLSKWQLDSLDPLSPVYARSRRERARAPTPIEHDGHIYDLVGVNSHQQLILRDQCALHLDIRIECFAGRAAIWDGVPWQVDYLEAIPDPLNFTKPPRRVLHLKRWTEKGQIQKVIDEPDNLRAIFPGSRGKHMLGPIKHGIVRMIPTASRQRIQKPLLPGITFEARLRGRELYGPFQIEAKKDGQLVAKPVLDGFCLIKFTIEPHEIASSYVRVNCPDFGGCFDIDAFLYCEDKLRCRATSVKAIRAMRLPTSDRDPMFGTLSRGPVPLLTNGLDHLVVFEKFIRDCTIPSPKTPQQRRLTILNLSMCDQGDAKIVVDALIDFREQNPDAIMSVVVSKLGPTIYQDTPACREYVKLLERNRIHIDMFTGVDGPTRQVVHAKAIVIDDRTLFSTGAIVDTKPIDKADFSIELPPTAAKSFQVYMQEAIFGGVSNERRAHLGSQLASLGVIINDPIASLTYISRAQHTLLRGARRDLLVSVSELVDPKITKLLVRRAANGVTVTIQVREIDAVSSRILTQATRRYGKRLLVEDVSWWEPRPHYNTIIADDSLAYLGTSYTKLSSYHFDSADQMKSLVGRNILFSSSDDGNATRISRDIGMAASPVNIPLFPLTSALTFDFANLHGTELQLVTVTES